MHYHWTKLQADLIRVHNAPVAGLVPVKEQYDHEINMGYIYMVQPETVQDRYHSSIDIDDKYVIDVDVHGIVLGVELIRPNPGYIQYDITYGYE